MDCYRFDEEDAIPVVEDEKYVGTETNERILDGGVTAGQGKQLDDGETERWREERHSEDTTRDDLPLIKILSFLGFCVAALGWVVFFTSRLLRPPQHAVPIPAEGKVLDFYSHVAIDLYHREPQDQAMSVLPLLSGAVPSAASASIPSSSRPSSSSTSTRPDSSLATISTATVSTISSSSTAGATPTSVLQVFQLDAPIMGPGQVVLDDGIGNTSTGDSSVGGVGTSCQVTLMEHEFKDSFGKPFVGNFTPPACMGDSNTAMMNLTVRSIGGQFDRLATMYLGDTEVFRTSTAEPKRSGIAWTYMKDMSHLMSLWKMPQKVIFDLPNQTNVNITGTYMTSLTATFFSASESVDAANVILPLSAKRGINESVASTFTIPSTTQNATTTLTAGSFPRNAKRAIVSIAATGQGDEEFWWQNVLSSAVSTYNSSGGVLFGSSSFREVQLWVDGQMAGVVWPFPVIFTGGVVPAFWSPMVGMQVFDMSEGQIDVTPWLESLCDGKAHNFDMKVVGLSDNAGETAVLNQGVGSNWVVSGKIFIWTDSNTSAITTSDMIKISSSDPEISVSQAIRQNTTGGNDTLVYTTSVRRSLTITSNIKTSQYPNGRVAVWTQTLSQTTNNALTSQGNVQENTHTTSGKDSFLLGTETPYINTYSYPLFANTTVTNMRNGSFRIDAVIDRSYHSDISGQGASPSGLQPFAYLAASSRLVETLGGTTLSQTQSGNATLIFAPGSGGGVAANGSVLFGSLTGTARFGGRSSQGVLGMEKDEELWFRMVKVVNASVREDVQRLNGKGVGGFGVVNASSSAIDFDDVDFGSARFLGRNAAGMGG